MDVWMFTIPGILHLWECSLSLCFKVNEGAKPAEFTSVNNEHNVC